MTYAGILILGVIAGLLIGVTVGAFGLASNDDVVLVNRNVDGTKWVVHGGTKYSLFNAEGGAK